MATRSRRPGRGIRRLAVGIAAGAAALLAVPVAMTVPATSAAYTDGEYASGVGVSVAHFVKPVIAAVTGANTAPFVGQVTATTQQAYLKGLATAHDDHDGDLTSALGVDSDLDPAVPGGYTATYEVANSFGVAADPMSIPLTVWDFTKVESGFYQTLALTSHGEVWGWGYNPWGSVTLATGDVRVPTLLTQLGEYTIVDVAAAVDTSYAVTSAGAVLAWGYNGNGQYGNASTASDHLVHTVPLPAGVKIVQISASYYSVAALSSTGDVYAWGMADYGATGTGSTGNTTTPALIMSNAKQVSQGWWGGAAVDGNGAVWVWGTNIEGELGNLLSGGYAYKPTMVLTSLLGGVKSVSYGGRHVMALTNSGQVYAWGQNSSNQVAPPVILIGTTNPVTTPTAANGPGNVVQILAGYDYSMAVTASGNVWVWGNQDYGEFLTGNTADYTAPTQVPGLSGVAMVAGELDSTVYLSTDGATVRGAGWNADYELGNNATATTTALQYWAFTPPPL